LRNAVLALVLFTAANANGRGLDKEVNCELLDLLHALHQQPNQCHSETVKLLSTAQRFGATGWG
jgi:hypothetical protein